MLLSQTFGTSTLPVRPVTSRASRSSHRPAPSPCRRPMPARKQSSPCCSGNLHTVGVRLRTRQAPHTAGPGHTALKLFRPRQLLRVIGVAFTAKIMTFALFLGLTYQWSNAHGHSDENSQQLSVAHRYCSLIARMFIR